MELLKTGPRIRLENNKFLRKLLAYMQQWPGRKEDRKQHSKEFNNNNHFTAPGLCPVQLGTAGTRRNIHPTHLSWSSIIPYLLHPSFAIHCILYVQFTCLTVFFHNLSPSFLRTAS